MAKSDRMTDRYTHEYFEAAGVALGQVGRALEGYRDLSVQLVGLSVRGPQAEGGEMLMTLRGLDESGGRVVAFQTAMTLIELFRGLEGRLESGTINWRPDAFVR